MGLFSRKNEPPKGKKAYEQGYVSFTADDLKEGASRNPANDEAYGYLDAAMFTSSHISEYDKNRGTVDIDDVYPITLEETLEMEGLLDKADAALKDNNDSFYHARANELRGIVEWSKKRHWNFSWSMLFGALIVCFFAIPFFGMAIFAPVGVRQEVKKVKAWAEVEVDSVIPLDSLQNPKRSGISYKDAVDYKVSILNTEAKKYWMAVKNREHYLAILDTLTRPDRREYYQEEVEQQEDKMEAAKEVFDETNEMDFDDLQDQAVSEKRSFYPMALVIGFFSFFLFFYFLLLCPLYIYAERPYGYMISRNRAEARVLGGIKKVAFGLAGGLLSMAASIGFVDVVTKWSDGTTTREDDGTAPIRIALKLGLVCAAAIVYIAVSFILVSYCTIVGLKRNYDWEPAKAKAREIWGKVSGKVQAKIEEKIAERKDAE